MKQKYELKLKPINSNNPDNLRIYDMVQKSCEGLNSYLADFFETVAILEEQKTKSGSDNKDIDESIEFVLVKIDEVTASMKSIVNDMPFLVELIEIH
jgi:hypothetical protein